MSSEGSANPAGVGDEYLPSPLTTARRHQDRVSYDRRAVHQVLDEAVICHVGYVAAGRPQVLANLHVRVDDVLYLHGAIANGLNVAGRNDGLQVCVAVTLMDGLVLARSAFNHSVNYRSVVVHGTARLVGDAGVKAAVLEALTDHLVPGRSATSRRPTDSELAQTGVLALPLVDVSLKVRGGDPKDDDEDLALPYWAGVLPTRTEWGSPRPAADLAADAWPAPAPR